MTATIAQLQQQAAKTFEEAEARAARWYPPDGIYSAVISSFASTVRQQRDPKGSNLPEYVSYEVGFTLSGEEFADKETATFYDTQIRDWTQDGQKQSGSISLGQFKTLCAILNDGEIPETLEACAELVDACASNKVPVQISVSTSESKGRTYHEISVVELGSTEA